MSVATPRLRRLTAEQRLAIAVVEYVLAKGLGRPAAEAALEALDAKTPEALEVLRVSCLRSQ